jgi:hypothetical protein
VDGGNFPGLTRGCALELPDWFLPQLGVDVCACVPPYSLSFGDSSSAIDLVRVEFDGWITCIRAAQMPERELTDHDGGNAQFGALHIGAPFFASGAGVPFAVLITMRAMGDHDGVKSPRSRAAVFAGSAHEQIAAENKASV